MRWVQLQQNGTAPEARSSHTITAIGTNLYLWGGENEPREPIDSVMHVYNLETSTWKQLEVSGDTPAPRNAPTAAAVDSKIYVFGGRTGIEMGEGSLAELYAFDTATNSWSKVEPQGEGAAWPPKRSYHASAAQGDKLYVFGGCGEAGRLNDLWQFDTTNGTWTQLPTSDAIKGRGGCGFAAAPDALFVIGGFTGKEMNDVHRFDIASGTWCCGQGGAGASSGAACGGAAGLPARSVFALATHQGCRSSCSHGQHIVVFGGEVEPTDLGHAAAGQFSNDVFCFDAKAGADGWHKLEAAGEAPCPRGWLAATACPAGIVISGGNSNSNERLGDLYLLDMHD